MFKTIGILGSVLLIALLVGGYVMLRRQYVPMSASNLPRPTATPQLPPALHVFEDEAYLKKGAAIIGGTIQNVSESSISRVLLQIKLRSRDGKREELRSIVPSPADIAPQERATYSLSVPSNEWSAAKVVAVSSSDAPDKLAYISIRGKARPRELPPPATVRTITIERPAQAKQGEEFLNTPDNPVIVK